MKVMHGINVLVNNNYSKQDWDMRSVLRSGVASDDELIVEFDCARGQTRLDIYRVVFKYETDSESEDDEPQPTRRSKRPKKYVDY